MAEGPWAWVGLKECGNVGSWGTWENVQLQDLPFKNLFHVCVPECKFAHHMCEGALINGGEGVRFPGSGPTTIVSWYVGAWNWTSVICKSNKGSSPLSHLSNCWIWVLNLKHWISSLSTFIHWNSFPTMGYLLKFKNIGYGRGQCSHFGRNKDQKLRVFHRGFPLPSSLSGNWFFPFPFEDLSDRIEISH